MSVPDWCVLVFVSFKRFMVFVEQFLQSWSILSQLFPVFHYFTEHPENVFDDILQTILKFTSWHPQCYNSQEYSYLGYLRFFRYMKKPWYIDSQYKYHFDRIFLKVILIVIILNMVLSIILGMILFKFRLVGWLVSLFNGISTFAGYLMPKPFY